MVSKMLWCRQAKSRSPERWGISENPQINKKLSFPWTGKWRTTYYTNWCIFLSVFCCLGSAVNKNKTVYVDPFMRRCTVNGKKKCGSTAHCSTELDVRISNICYTTHYRESLRFGEHNKILERSVLCIHCWSSWFYFLCAVFNNWHVNNETYLWIAWTLSAGILF